MDLERYPMSRHQRNRTPDGGEPMYCVATRFVAHWFPCNGNVLAEPLREYTSLRISLRNQLRELLLGCFKGFRASADVRKTSEVGPGLAAWDNYGECLPPVLCHDDLHHVRHSRVDIVHQPVEFLLSLIQVVLRRFDVAIVPDS